MFHILQRSKTLPPGDACFWSVDTASTLGDLDDMIRTATVVFASRSTGANVERHFSNLQTWLQKKGTQLDETAKPWSDPEGLEVNDNSLQSPKQAPY